VAEAPDRREGMYHIGVISDTHGLILHAGDVGSPQVLRSLRCIAPVIAVRGNTDSGSGVQGLSATETVEIAGFLFHILHDLSCIDLDPVAAGMHAVISGHSHRPSLSTDKGVLYLNPGSAGPRRFSLPVTLARIAVFQEKLHPEILYLT